MSFVLLEWAGVVPVAEASRIAIRSAACRKNDAQNKQPNYDENLDRTQPELDMPLKRWTEELAHVSQGINKI